MKEFLQTILKSTEDRIKNPFIGTFITSWAIFNWKPITFIVFSDKSIEEKIKFIGDNYSDIWCYLWLPLMSAIFYIAILPYISFAFEYITKFSHGLRNKVNLEARNAALELQIGVAQNEIKLEEEKTTFRERNSHNLMVESLQEQNKSLSEALEEANKTHLETVTELQKKSENASKEFSVLAANYDKQLEESNTNLIEERNKILNLRKEVNELNKENNHYFNNASQLKRELEIEKFISFRLKNPVNKILSIEGYNILEFFNSQKEVFYFDIKADKILSTSAVYDFTKGKGYSEILDEEQLRRYTDKMFSILPFEDENN
ncbi:hypothetical protein [Chryseobacterium indologenes]|uniref:hypothetical protein n=1 Tax=Chryseobacterium indologenes TaxID=253 RepID=UPI001BCBB2D6|nr:hypothetical protein [Chryseobacterium indologenes]